MARIYTRTGDKGTTGIHGGERVPKDDIRIEANGTLDELNCHIGVVRSMIAERDERQELLHEIQQNLMVVMSLVATPSGIREKNPNELPADLVSRCDIVIVSFHGGAEGKTKCHLPQGTETFLGENRGSLRELAHFCIDHGADIVYGHGPHVMRAVEVYKNRFIAYSLGNFCTTYNVSLSGISGHAPLMVVTIDDNGNFLKGDVHPMIQTRGIGPRHDKTGSVLSQLKMLSETDIPQSQARIDKEGHIYLKK